MKNVIEKYVGSHSHVEQGEQYFYNCPSCGHKRFTINYSENKFRCWKCGYSSKSVISLLYDQKASYSDISKVKKHLGIQDHYGEGDRRLESKIDDILFPKDKNKKSVKWDSKWVSILSKGVMPMFARKYIADRGVSKYEMQYYSIQYDPVEDMIVFPSFDLKGDLNFFVKRTIGDYSFYKNCDYPKKDIVFYESLIDFRRPINIVEGIFDVYKIGDNTLPLLGSIMTNRLYRLILAYETPTINIILDPDAQQSANVMAEKLFRGGIKNVHCINLRGKDPADHSKKELKDVIYTKQDRVPMNTFNLIENNLKFI